MTKPVHMIGWLTIGFLAGFGLLLWWIDSSKPLVALPALTWIAPLVLASAILLAGWPVRAMSQGKRRTMSPLVAARIAILAGACARAGALLTGLCLGAWAAYEQGHAVFLDEQSARALWAAAGSGLLGGAGWLVEYWCSIDDDDGEDGAQAHGAA